MNVDGDLTAAVGALVAATTAGGFSTSFVVLTLVEVVVVVFEVVEIESVSTPKKECCFCPIL